MRDYFWRLFGGIQVKSMRCSNPVRKLLGTQRSRLPTFPASSATDTLIGCRKYWLVKKNGQERKDPLFSLRERFLVLPILLPQDKASSPRSGKKKKENSCSRLSFSIRFTKLLQHFFFPRYVLIHQNICHV